MDNQKDCYSIGEFCERHGIFRAYFYLLPPHKRPAIIALGKRRLISKEAAAEWRRRMETTAARVHAADSPVAA